MRRLAAILFISSATLAHAQTADETVLYLMHGLEGQEKQLPPINGQISALKPVDGNGAQFLIGTTPANLVAMVEYRYTKIDDCMWSLAAWERHDASLVKGLTVTLDFSKASAAKLVNLAGSGGGLRITDVEGLQFKDCVSESGSSKCEELKGGEGIQFPTAADPDRLTKALAYFQQTYCKGSAF
jgi:hypothetical protein